MVPVRVTAGLLNRSSLETFSQNRRGWRRAARSLLPDRIQLFVIDNDLLNGAIFRVIPSQIAFLYHPLQVHLQ